MSQWLKPDTKTVCKGGYKMLPLLQMADRERLKVGSSKGRVRTADEHR